MIIASLASALLGLTAAYAALHHWPARFRHHALAMATGPGAAFAGALGARAVLGPGQLPLVLATGVVVSVVLLSLLVETAPPAARHREAVGLQH